MGATSGSLFDLHSNRIEEVINKNIETFLPAMDPVWRDTVVSSQGVGPASAIGRDMSIIKVYMGSMAGVLQMSTPGANGNEFGLFGDDTDTLGNKMYQQNLAQTFPDATLGPNAKPYRLKIPMRAMTSNLMMTLGELQAEATPAFIGSVIAPKLEGFARLISHTICNSWYVSGNDTYQLGTVASEVTAAATSYEFTVTEKSVDRFAVGQRVDVYDGTAGNVRTHLDGSTGDSSTLPVFVGAVDEVKGTVTLVANFTNADLTAIDVGDIIKIHGQTEEGGASYGIAGLNSWLKWDSTSNATKRLLGAEADGTDHIDVTVHPEFRSFRKGSVGALTEHKLRQYLHGFHRAKDKYGQYIDCLVASDGVWMNYESQKIGQYMIDRTGRPSSMNSQGSQEGFTFACDGRSYKGYTSQFVEKETVYGIRKGGNNWKRYVPPSQAGVQKFDKAESFIPFEFTAPALGYSGIKAPITNTGGARGLITEGVQMPGQLRMQLVPDQPAGMKLEGVTEDRIYGDNT